jgi:uncharacterized protein (UPF0276 family)
MQRDRVGLGWRPELAAGIFANLDKIDILEVVADNYLEAHRRQRLALKLLSREVPLHIHSIDLGMAGSAEVNTKRVDRLARLINDVEPEAWSEHLAFVRAGELEIGHLAATPRNDVSVAGTATNVKKAAQIIGSLPFMENIATLLQPPCSTLSEQSWISDIVAASGCGILLDLHNLYANAVNFSFDPLQFLAEIPMERVECIHIAGGKWISSPDGTKQYLLDDHLHEVTDPIYALLSEVAARATQPLTVILERDGAYPPMDVLLHELERTRGALAAGRQRNPMIQRALANAG